MYDLVAPEQDWDPELIPSDPAPKCYSLAWWRKAQVLDVRLMGRGKWNTVVPGRSWLSDDGRTFWVLVPKGRRP